MQNKSTIEVRKITAEERAAFLRSCQYAFDQWKDAPPTEDSLAGLNLEECMASFEDGQLVSTLENRSFQQSVRGILKAVGGIGAVTTDPCFRRRGHIRRLMEAAFEDMRTKGQVVSALWPFRRSFYAAYGYVPIPSCLRVKVSSRAFRPYIPHAKAEDGWHYQRERAIDVREKFDGFLREVAIKKYSSYIIDLPDDEANWAANNRDNLIIFVEREGRVEAVARYTMKRVEQRGVFDVYDMYWRSLSGRDKLFGYLALHNEQTELTSIPVPEGTSFQQWIDQPAQPFELELSRAPMMVRIMDVVGGLSGLPAQKEGHLAISVTDERCSWNTGTYRLSSSEGQLTVERIEKAPAETIPHLTIEGLTALAYGTHPLDELAHVGWVTGLSQDSHALLGSWFPEALLYNIYFF